MVKWEWDLQLNKKWSEANVRENNQNKVYDENETYASVKCYASTEMSEEKAKEGIY